MRSLQRRRPPTSGILARIRCSRVARASSCVETNETGAMDVTQLPIRAARDGSELCLQCGLCCDGIMFSEISVRPHERDYVESLGLPVDVGLDGSGVTVFQPCPAFTEGCCSLYEVGR